MGNNLDNLSGIEDAPSSDSLPGGEDVSGSGVLTGGEDITTDEELTNGEDVSGDEELSGGEDVSGDGELSQDNLLGDGGQLLASENVITGSGQLAGDMVVVQPLAADELREAVFDALDDYFSAGPVSVSVQPRGIDTPLDDIGLTDGLLLVLVLVVLGRAVCDIIGGKNRWRK